MFDLKKYVHCGVCCCDGLFLCIMLFIISKRICLMLQNIFFVVAVVVIFSLILLLIAIFFSVLMCFFVAFCDDLACLCLKMDIFDISKHIVCGSCCRLLLLDIVVDCHFFSMCWYISLSFFVMTSLVCFWAYYKVLFIMPFFLSSLLLYFFLSSLVFTDLYAFLTYLYFYFQWKLFVYFLIYKQ